MLFLCPEHFPFRSPSSSFQPKPSLTQCERATKAGDCHLFHSLLGLQPPARYVLFVYLPHGWSGGWSTGPVGLPRAEGSAGLTNLQPSLLPLTQLGESLLHQGMTIWSDP